MAETTAAVMGAGGIAKNAIVPALADLGIPIVGVSRRTPGKAAEFAAGVTNANGTPVQAFEDAATMVRVTRPTFVIDTSGSGGHLENALICTSAGVPYLGEKPLIMGRTEYDTLREAAGRSGTKVGGILQHHFLGVYQAVLDAVAGGRFGKITLWQIALPWHRPDSYYAQHPWRGKRASDGGVIMNQTLHEVGELILLAAAELKLPAGVSPIEDLTARCVNLGHQGTIEVEDTAAVMLRLKSGALATIGCTTAAGGKKDGAKKFAVYGTHGKVEIAGNALTLWDFGDTDESERMLGQFGAPASGSGARDPLAIGHLGHRENIRAFVAWLGSGGYAIDLPVAALPPLTVETMYASSDNGGKWLSAPDTVSKV